MAIPKIIHYCWFGGTPLPESVIKCINSWEKHCPDYQIVRWDESNYDYKKNRFAYDAYNHKKWAFVSDVARLDIVYNYGGIYLDTDVELIKSLDFLIDEHAFMAFEHGRSVATGLGFGAEKGNKIIARNLMEYDAIDFVNSDGTLNLISCPIITTNLLEKLGLVRADKMQVVEGVRVFPTSYFCPRLFSDGTAEIGSKTVSIHHYAASWTTEEERRIEANRRAVYTKYGRVALRIYDGWRMLHREGLAAVLKRCVDIIFLHLD